MPKLFVVTSGAYSDYGILAIFDSLELAQAMIAGHDGYEIEEYTLNPGESAFREGRQRFEVRMLRDGSVARATALGWAWAEPEWVDEWSYESTHEQWLTPEKIIAICMKSNVWARDEAHAIKIANERRAQHIASGQWDKGEANVRSWPQFHNADLWKVEC